MSIAELLHVEHDEYLRRVRDAEREAKSWMDKLETLWIARNSGEWSDDPFVLPATAEWPLRRLNIAIASSPHTPDLDGGVFLRYGQMTYAMIPIAFEAAAFDNPINTRMIE